MTLFKQLALLLSLFLLVILTTVTILDFTSTIDNAERQLHIDAQNTASSLSLSLATAKGDESIMATMINANFDSGHYRQITLNNMNQETIYKRIEDICKLDVPEWFINLVSINVPSAQAQVSAGWMVVGTLHVDSDLSPTYLMLYSSFKHMLITFTLFMVISLSILHLLLFTILKPLRALQEQAEAINQNEFRYQEDVPYTTEFSEIVMSMNALVKKIENNFKANSLVVQHNRQQLYTEKLPKLYNEHYLMLKCNEEFMESSEYDGGAVIVTEIATEDEEVLTSLASIMIEKGDTAGKNLVARVKKNRLVLLIPGAGEFQACVVKNAITETFLAFADSRVDVTSSLECGVHIFKAYESCQDFLDKAVKNMQTASEDVCSTEKETLRYKEQLSQEDWLYLINTALRKELFSYKVRNVLDTSNNTIYDRGISIIMRDTKGSIYPYGSFIATAVKSHKILDIYLKVIKTLVTNFSGSEKQGRYTFSFANTLLLEKRTFSLLEEEFNQFDNTHQLDFCIELPERFLVSDAEMAKKYVELIKTHGYRFGIGEFSAESDDFEYLKMLKPEFIKINKLFLLDMINQTAPLLSSLLMVTDSLGIKIIATGVSTDDELETIKSAGIEVVQGFITEVL